ncbi:hypothetical protein BKA65DRAFT_507603 [Rhexocercosporidium sp. MPI-PUGE-AT-0058]|nr:hypothetical protein BKA65DRAFT_507603 [Rhexocercosporidium sp. MPI-PUGE-AT-0058]
MPKQKKTWILVKGTEFNPGRSLSLGQILTKPFEPSLPLFPNGLPVPEASIERSHQTGVKLTSRTALGVSFGLWAEVDLLPVSGNVGGKHETSHEKEWEFEKLESEINVPRIADVQAALEKPEIVAHLQRIKFDFRKRLYMITGVRIARGARSSSKDSKTRGGNATILGDLTALGAPVKVGPEVDVTRENSGAHSFKGASDFVYAYRVCEVHYGKSVYTKPFNKGDSFAGGKNTGEEGGSQNDDDAEGDEDDEEPLHILVEKIAEEDFAGTIGTDATILGAEEEDQFIMPTNK